MSNFVQLEIDKKNRWIYFSKYRWVAHVVYWIWVLVVGTLLHSKVPITPSVIFNRFFLDNLVIASFFYIYCLYLIPYFFKRNRYLLFWVMIIAGHFVFGALEMVFNNFLSHFRDPEPVVKNLTFFARYYSILASFLLNFLLFSIMLFFMEKNEENDTMLELEKEKREIEQVKLDLLKTNISPDFLLRSLQQLKRTATVPEAYTPEAILTFSDLLRYRLYRGRQHKTPLKEELQALNSFIHFIDLDQQQSNLKVVLNLQGAIEDKSLAPLSLINLLEPFCKIQPLKPSILDIILLIEPDELLMEMFYDTKASPELLADLEQYGSSYTQLYGDTVKFEFEDCENGTCTIRLSLPLSVA